MGYLALASCETSTNQKHSNVQLCLDMFHEDCDSRSVIDSFLNRISRSKMLWNGLFRLPPYMREFEDFRATLDERIHDSRNNLINQ